MTKTVQYIGDSEYHGHDGVIGKPDTKRIDLVAGADPIEVSDEKAAQLARDFPNDWLIDGKAPKGATPPKPKDDETSSEIDDVAEVHEFDAAAAQSLSLAKLIELAGEAGVDAETLASFSKPGTSKKKVIEAIVAAKAETPAS